MNDRAIRILEFDKIRNMLSEYAISDMGRDKCLALKPDKNKNAIENSQQETQEAVYVLRFKGRSPVNSFQNVKPHLSRAEKGATLSIRALMEISTCLGVSRKVRAQLVQEDEFTPSLRKIASELYLLKELENEINECIINEDSIADNASPELMNIRRQIRHCNERIQNRLNNMVNSNMNYLQEPIITLRNGRYCLPVKLESRRNVPGIVHDQSSSGATLFIEPLALVEMGNELKQLNIQEQQEIERILSHLSAMCADNEFEISANVDILCHIDFVFAKAQLALSMEGIRPNIRYDKSLNLIKARHPLLPKESVVPCDIWLGDSFTTLVITGPNTGGKTVTLKTVGLISMMAQAGLHIPANAGTQLAVFDEIYADIGDEQSIEQSLSTFSSHMSNIVKILETANEDSLVLFDELGAGTDPTEGSALARAILGYLTDRKILTIATTHYSELKAYALSTEGVENASVEFDVESLRPTYRLSVGIPGKSNAFEISERLGLPKRFIESARQYLSSEELRFEDVIASAEHHRQIARREKEKAEQMYSDALEIKRKSEDMHRKAEEKYEQAIKSAKSEAKKLLDKTKRESASIIEELKRLQKESKIPWHEINKQADRFGEINSLFDTPKKLDNNQPLSPEEIEIGDTVKLNSTGTQATVLSLPDKSGRLSVQAGQIKLDVSIDMLSQSQVSAKKQRSFVSKSTVNKAVSLSCDVRGLNLEEAILETDRYLDNATMNGLKEVSIIHGKGSGVLRKGIQEHLKKHKQVEEYRLGRFGEGEDGVTVVKLR